MNLEETTISYPQYGLYINPNADKRVYQSIYSRYRPKTTPPVINETVKDIIDASSQNPNSIVPEKLVNAQITTNPLPESEPVAVGGRSKKLNLTRRKKIFYYL
jgi:hypothetical protein